MVVLWVLMIGGRSVSTCGCVREPGRRSTWEKIERSKTQSVAELELSIQYKSLPARVGLTTMGALMPIWALFIPFLLGQFIQLVLTNPQLALNPWLCLA